MRRRDVIPIVFLAVLVAGCGYQFRVEGAGPTIGGGSSQGLSGPAPRLVIQNFQERR